MDIPTQRLIPNIWIDHDAEGAGRFYQSALPFARAAVESWYPAGADEGLADFQQDFAGQPLTVALEVHGTLLRLINGGPAFRPTPSLSFMLNFDPLLFSSPDEGGPAVPDAADDELRARAALEATWQALADGGVVRMELGAYPFSALYGWVEDRYGVNWQLMLTDPAGDPRPFVVPALMFGGRAQDKAAEAADFYVDLLADTPGGAAIGHRFPYGQPTGPASADALAYGEFRVGEQWLVASDFGADHAFSFSEGVSLEVRCSGQAEIDRLWAALSRDPEAEACGWCRDRYGVSWQVVPEDIERLMARPGAYRNHLSMKRIVIADL